VSAARNYWKNGTRDFIQTATKNFATSYYVVGYNGTNPYWGARRPVRWQTRSSTPPTAAPTAAANHCARTFAQGGTFWVVGHSMAGPIMDYILGNNDASDPNFNANGPYDQVAQRLSLVITHGRRAPRLARRRRRVRQRQHLVQLHRRIHPVVRYGDLLAAQCRRRAGAHVLPTRQRATSI
jgi:hypothetical protein